MTLAERPILFSGPMVRAILAGRKTQTRRIIKGAPDSAGRALFAAPIGKEHKGWSGALFFAGETAASRGLGGVLSPYGRPGDRLWVRETWATGVEGCPGGLSYRADHRDPKGDGPANPMRWHPSTHMPRWASRLMLEIVGVRVERLQAISEADALAEGCGALCKHEARGMYDTNCSDCMDTGYDNGRAPIDEFAALWDSLARPGTKWDDNPWVWVVEFKRVEV